MRRPPDYGDGVKKWSAPSQLDRVEEHRGNEAWVARQWAREDALLLRIDSEGRYASDASGEALHLVQPHDEFEPDQHFLLGLVEGRPVFVAETLDPEDRSSTIRESAAKLSVLERDVVFMARALTNWHRMEPHCAFCGQPNHVRRGGLMRHCTACGRDTWPRTDPAVIVAILNERDEILLAHHLGWVENRVSILAGFVETGESLEQAVHREILEEVDIELTGMRYVSSQPWPFPRSLMTGFVARALDETITVDAEELGWADWFSRERVRKEAGDGTIILPGRASLAHRLIRSWLEGRLSVQSCFPGEVPARTDTGALSRTTAPMGARVPTSAVTPG